VAGDLKQRQLEDNPVRFTNTDRRMAPRFLRWSTILVLGVIVAAALPHGSLAQWAGAALAVAFATALVHAFNQVMFPPFAWSGWYVGENASRLAYRDVEVWTRPREHEQVDLR
jgi:hypothetical protein